MLLILMFVIVVDGLLFVYNCKEDHRMIYILSIVMVVDFIAYYFSSRKLMNCKFDAIKKQFSAHDLFVFLLKRDISTKKIMVSNNRKTIRIYRNRCDIDIENDDFIVEGVGNTVYLIDLDEKYIYVD